MCEFNVIGPTKTMTVTKGISISAPSGFSTPERIDILEPQVNYCPSCKSENLQVVPDNAKVRKNLGFEY
jgi:hypothetical protein